MGIEDFNWVCGVYGGCGCGEGSLAGLEKEGETGALGG